MCLATVLSFSQFDRYSPRNNLTAHGNIEKQEKKQEKKNYQKFAKKLI